MARESLPPLPLLACACASLRRTARVVTQLYETELQGTGLRIAQFTLLQALEQMRGAASQGALGRLLALDATTLSRTLPPLERAGWIRAAAGKDRREVRWSLTPAGRRRLAGALPAWERAQQRLRNGLPARHWRMLIEDLAAVGAAARSQR
jgi:DNA-binding MarR family transcriptional regulator